MNSNSFQPALDSVETHALPQWYDDCKLGIFIHWGLYSVPAWAEVTWELGGEPSDLEWFTHNPYAEWYLNTIRIEGSPAREHHKKTYGADFPYEKFAESFTCENWDIREWARLFKQAGAGYHEYVAGDEQLDINDSNTINIRAGLRFQIHGRLGVKERLFCSVPVDDSECAGETYAPRLNT